MTDVVVVGAGLIGLGIAHELAKRGVQVTVYERDEPARAASWAGAGMLAPFSERITDDAMRALCRDALAMYPGYVDELREQSGVDARLLRSGTLHVALDDARLAELAAHAATMRREGALVSILDRGQTLANEPLLAKDLAGACWVENEAQVDNRRLGRALSAACTALGVRFERAEVVALECDARRVRGLRTPRGFTAAGTVINATGAWAGELAGVPAHARVPVVPIAGEMLTIAIPAAAVRALVWIGHRYLVPRGDGRLLVGATVAERGYDARVTAAGIHDLLDAALSVAPALASFAVVETWAGLRPGSADGRPYLGPTAVDGYVVATGHYRNGILLAPITARLIAAAVVDGDTTALRAFLPARAGPEAVGAAAKDVR